MRILVANKFWYRRAGLERVMLDEVRWLEAAGATVAHFSTAHPENDPSPWAEYFVPYLELGPHGGLTLGEKALATLRLFRSTEAARRFGRLLADFRPDIVHIHGIHRQLSPSILEVAHRRGVPVIQSLHDLHHICPSDVMMRAGLEPCEPRRCGVLWYGACVRWRCVRGSLPASVLSAAETSWQRVTRVYERCVARFISPSRFHAARMREGGWTLPIDIVPNAVEQSTSSSAGRSGFVMIGRLAREKGIYIAAEAARRAGVHLTIAGEGPLGAELRASFPDITFTGHLGGDDVERLVVGARAVIVPSLTFENAPMAVLEAMAAGTPVLASQIGGIPEQITDGMEGLLIAPGDVDALAAAMRRLASDDALVAGFGEVGRRTVAERFDPQSHVERLLDSYRAAGAAG